MVIPYANIEGGPASSGSAMTNHLMNNTVSVDECRLAAYYGRGAIEVEPAVLAAARAVATREMTYSEALDGLMADYVRRRGHSFGEVSHAESIEHRAYEDRISKRLAVLASRIEDGLLDAPIAIVRPDIHPMVARALGIEPDGLLAKKEIDALIMGLRSDGERVVGKTYAKERSLPPNARTGKERSSKPIGATDFTPTPSKHISVAWAFANDLEKAKILNCHLEAAREAVGYIAKEVGRARIGAGGEGGFLPGHVGWIEFTHHTSRPVKMTVVNGEAKFDQDLKIAADPDIHTHFLLHNSVHCDDGRVGSLDTARLKGFIFEADALYQSRLAHKLRDAGFDAELDPRTGAARMPAIPDEVCDHFSKRTKAGEAYAKIQSAKRGEVWDELTAEQKAERIGNATQDRNQKSKGEKDGQANFADWNRQVDEIGWQRPASFLAYGPRLAERDLLTIHREAYEVALDILEKRFEQRSVLTSWEIRTAIGQGLVQAGCPSGVSDIDGVVKIMGKEGVRQYGEMTALRWGLETDGRQISVSTELHEQNEHEFIRLATIAARDKSAALPKAAIDAAVRDSGLNFSDEHGQKQLVMIHRLGGEGRVSVGVGAAGMGKTALLRPLRAAWEKAGRDVWGTSLASRQTDDLADAGIKPQRLWAFSVMVDKIKSGEATLTGKSVLCVDELGLLGTRQGLELLRLREKHGFQVVSLGDPVQIKSIEAGSIFGLFSKAIGPENMPEIATTKRQKTAREQEIVGLIRDGQPGAALAMKRKDGTAELVQGGDRAVIARVAQIYGEKLTATGKAPAIAAPTNAEAHQIGEAVRAERRRLGMLGPDVRTMRATDGERHYPLSLAVGDRVRLFRSTGADYGNGRGGPIGRNGKVLEVMEVSNAGIILKNEKGRVGHVAWDKLTDDKSGRVLLAYGDCRTVHSDQGSGTPTHILALPHGSKGLQGGKGYSGLTRHEWESTVVTNRTQEYAAVVQSRAKNDIRPVTDNDCWAAVAENLLPGKDKDLATNMVARVSELRRGTVRAFHAALQPAAHRQAHGLTPSDAPDLAQQKQAARTPGLQQAMSVVRDLQQAVQRTVDAVRHIQRQTVGRGRSLSR